MNDKQSVKMNDTSCTKVLWGLRGRFFKRAPLLPEAKICRVLFTLFLFLFISILPAAEKDIKDMSYEELGKKYREITGVKRFLQTDIPKRYAWSMNEFFDHSIYEKLVGNEFFGYYHDEGIKYDEPGNRIVIDTIAVIKDRGYDKYKDIYTRIFLHTLRESNQHTYYVVKEARYSIGICVVSIKEKDNEESLKGVVVETYIKDRKTGKHFYHRCGTGSPGGLDQAMRLSAVRVLCNLEYLKNKKLNSYISPYKQKFLGGPRGAILQKSPPGRRRLKALASGGSEPFWKKVPTPPKTFINFKEGS
jgi:hypothetical protein